MPNGAIKILHVGKKDAGLWRCIGINVLGKVSAAATLTVQGKIYTKLIDKAERTTPHVGKKIGGIWRCTGSPVHVSIRLENPKRS